MIPLFWFTLADEGIEPDTNDSLPCPSIKDQLNTVYNHHFVDLLCPQETSKSMARVINDAPHHLDSFPHQGVKEVRNLCRKNLNTYTQCQLAAALSSFGHLLIDMEAKLKLAVDERPIQMLLVFEQNRCK